MIKIYFKTALRQLKRFGSLSTITILGLSMGFTCVILLSIWINYEYQYDRFYKKTDRLYKVYLEETSNGDINKHPWIPFPLTKALRDEIPEIENSAIVKSGSIKVKYKDFLFYENRTCFTEETIFDVFDLEFIRGSQKEAFRNKESVVITEKTAQKYFGDENPIGKSIIVNDDYTFEITAVIKNIPKNSSINYDLFILGEHYSDPLIYNNTHWSALNFNGYLTLKEKTNPNHVRTKIRNISIIHKPERNRHVNIQSIKKSHFYNVSGSPANIKNIRIMSILGLVIFLVALINFINISIGQYHKRMFEFRTKEILGSNNKQVAVQLIVECSFTVLVSLILSFFISILLLPFAEDLTHAPYSINQLINHETIIIYISLFLATIVACSIPLGIFYSGKIKLNNRYKVQSSGYKQAYNSVFVTFQFAASILLLIAVMVVVRQLNFIMEKKIGMDTSNVIVLPLKGEDKENYPIIKMELLKNSHIQDVTAAYNWPTQIGTSCGISSWPGNENEERLELKYTVVDKDYFSTMGMTMVQGVPFSEKLESDTVAYILNETAVKKMNMKEPVGSEIHFDCWTTGKVIGVVKDFHFQSMHREIRPLIIVQHVWGAQNLIIKFNSYPDNFALSDVESIWKRINPQSPFSYQLLEHTTESMYNTEARFKKLLITCSIVALFLSAIGMLGIILMQAQKRIKEIGIRKVNGANVFEVMALLNRNFIKWICIAFIFAIPFSYYFMHNWLENFAYRITLSWWIFAIAGGLTLGITLLTVSWQSWRAATRNPVEALRYE